MRSIRIDSADIMEWRTLPYLSDDQRNWSNNSAAISANAGKRRDNTGSLSDSELDLRSTTDAKAVTINLCRTGVFSPPPFFSFLPFSPLFLPLLPLFYSNPAMGVKQLFAVRFDFKFQVHAALSILQSELLFC